MHGGKDQKFIPNNPIHKEKIYYAKILEIKPVMGYKYLKVNENGTIRWDAISNAPVKVDKRFCIWILLSSYSRGCTL